MDFDALHRLVAEAREAAAQTECAEHRNGQPPLWCGPCHADRYVAGDGDAVRRAEALKALVRCDREFPRRWYSAAVDHPDVAAWVNEVCADPSAGRWLLLMGLVGRGKSHQAYGAIRAVVAQLPGLEWAAIALADFAADLRPNSGVDGAALMRRCATAGLLLIDDIGAEKGSTWVEEVAYRLVNARYEAMLPTIFATNLPPDTLRAALGDRVTSRMAEMCVQVVLDGPDRRRRTVA